MVAFFIGLSEVLRRGLWTLFRVENEHCNNVGRFRASRDVPLPYEVEDDANQEMLHKTPEDIEQDAGTGTDGTAQQFPPSNRRAKSSQQMQPERDSHDGTRASATDIEHGHNANSTASLRRRRPSLTNSPIARAFRSAGNTMRSAHAQDYERKRKPENEAVTTDAAKDDDDDDISSDSDDDAGRQQPTGARHHVDRERRNSSDEDGSRELEEAEDLVARGGGG
jgi:hypothetical protein